MPARISKTGLLLVLIFIFLLSCNKGGKKDELSSPEYNPAVSAFTSGLITGNSNIRVRLSAEYKGEIVPGQALKLSPFEISPDVEGKTYWLDNRTLEFRPDAPLSPGTLYKVKLKLSKILGSREKDFLFSFNTIPLKLDLVFKGMKSYSSASMERNSISGEVIATDMVSSTDMEKILTARQDGRLLPVSWDHPSDKLHQFTIDSVLRKESPGSVEIQWDGNPYKLDLKGSTEFRVPSLGEFILMSHEVVQQPEQYVSLRFSDPLSVSQSLEGLVSLSNYSGLRFSVTDNEIKVYPEVRQYGKLGLNIFPGIQNILGYKLVESQVLNIDFEELRPAVRLLGEGVIIPGTEGILMPFEAVNLKAIDVRIIKIFEDNIGQFLQINNLSGSSELKRAGRLIIKKTIDLIPERPVSLGQWNTFSLDLGKLIKADPGSIYRVEISFRKNHSLFSCPDQENNIAEAETDDFSEINESDIAYWDDRSWYDSYEYMDYNWSERNDPCTESYYNYYERRVSRNILASNIGIMARQGQDKSLLFALTDLLTAEPLQGAKLEIYNYQQQLLASLTTNNEGIAKTRLDNSPYLLVAKKGDQRGYLNFENSYSLPVDQFDVGGSYTREGLKAFIYGERGVWRPGDSIFISLVLRDAENTLPPDHPVIFELRDPLGKVRQKTSMPKGNSPFCVFKTKTAPDDPTGTWNLKVSVGGADFFKGLRIETIKPNRFKINLDFGKEIIHASDKSIKGKLSVNWLHGAAAKNVMSRVEINFKNTETRFPGYKEYVFTDLTKDFSSQDELIYDSRLNSKGEAMIDIPFNLAERSPGMLNAVLTTRAFEDGGNFSIDQFSIPYSPYSVYLGIAKPKADHFGMMVTDSLHTIRLVSLDEYGKPAGRKKLEVSVFKLNWRWWWHSSDENLATYTGNPEKYAIIRKQITTGNDGKADFDIKIEYPEWGRYLIYVKDPEGGHSASETLYFDWPGWRGRADRQDPQAASMLSFSSDKDSYQVGETARLTIPTSGEGRLLLSIENGTRVIDHFWVKATGNETSFSFTITPEMTPNVYINACLIQPYARTKNDLPVRMYGIIPILVEDPETHLLPQIKMPEVLSPESRVKIQVNEQNGKEMTYTLAIVDEGLLDLTRFKTPDPWNEFFSKEALGVTSFDIYNFVLGAYGGRIDGIFSIGGDGEEEASGPEKSANRFPPVVRFEGPFRLARGKTNTHTINIPNYIGSVRTMVIAGNDKAYGKTDIACPVRKPLMVLSTLPRVLGPGEELSLPVTVFAMEDFIKTAEIQIEAGDLVELDEVKKTVSFDEPGDKTVDFRLRIREKTGITKIKVKVKSGKYEAGDETEIEVRSANQPSTSFIYSRIEPGKEWRSSIHINGLEGTNSGILEVFSIPPFDFGRRLKYLLNYPHGCIEQTTSAAFPQLYIPVLVEADENLLKVTESNVKAGIERLSKFLLPSGGFSYWPGSTAENDWGTSYAGHFMLSAREVGYDVPEEIISNWIKYQKNTARKWSNTRYESEWHKRELELQQAYRLYTLALAGKAEIGPMNRLRETTGISNLSKWYLAGAYALAGQSEAALEIVKVLDNSTDSYLSSYMYTYGSELRDKAIILEVLSLLKEKDKAVPVMEYIASSLSTDSWYSTQTTAFCLMAISKYLGTGKVSGELSYDYAWDNEALRHAATSHPVSMTERDFASAREADIRVLNKGEGSIFCRLSITGTPLPGKETAYSSNLLLDIDYRTLNGQSIDPARLEQGTDFMALVSIRNPGNLGFISDIALTQVFPSGWEILNSRMFESSLGNFDTPDYEDIRDDRIYRYINLYPGREMVFAVKLTAAYTGRFYLPTVNAEAMYRKDISVRVPGKWVEVVKAGGE